VLITNGRGQQIEVARSAGGVLAGLIRGTT
jgi:hypothetical protein